ncbi:Hypothetical protein PHPALM_14505 [Phytophthora palmivora]|uniref:Uncharacterized protein n=1 Tax=Phytophthora palmivora TaxID=4796 RepID=A0A2P4XUH0_9STRA|nr:Hypothetical protein PHPALM_14505 [Phytophthora palmivora]
MLMLLLSMASAVNMKLSFTDSAITFHFDTTQRCYTISHCFDDQSVNAEWSGLPDPSQLAFYSDNDCKGDVIHVALTRGKINFKGGFLYNKVSSFMVREYSMYPVNGIVNYCHEISLFNATGNV